MLLTKYVLMRWNPSNREWYRSKGYEFTKWHDEFEVKVEDLSKTSPVELNFECDYCQEKFTKTYDSYRKAYKNDNTGKHSCDECRDLRLIENKRIVAISNAKIAANTYETHYKVETDNATVFIKMCRTCGKYKELSCYRKSEDSKIIEYYNECTECEKEFYELNRMKYRLAHIKESSNRVGLPVPMTEKELENVFNKFNERCVLTNSSIVVCEHFIPIAWGHGGTYKGNIYLLSLSLNGSKGSLNPLKWIEKSNVKKQIDKKKWKDLISYLAYHNGLAVSEFKHFVNWCEKNKRSKEDIERDGNKTSLELWRESLNK